MHTAILHLSTGEIAGAKFYCLHAIADGNLYIQVTVKTLEFSSAVLPTVSLCHNITLIVTVIVCIFMFQHKGVTSEIYGCIDFCSISLDVLYLCVKDLKNEPYRRADGVRRSQRRHGDNHLKVGTSHIV